jgi:hypothetical protein
MLTSRIVQSDVEVKNLGPIAELIPQVGMHSPTVAPKKTRGRPPLKKESPGSSTLPSHSPLISFKFCDTSMEIPSPHHKGMYY